MPEILRVLCIEDNDIKRERIREVLDRVVPDAFVAFAKDQFDGEAKIDEGGWDLILLDISLDIRASQSRSSRGGHDYTGGLKIAGRMYYHQNEAPTIIITGFDAFPSGKAVTGGDVILGLEDVVRLATKYLGEHLFGTIRYGPAGWDDKLADMLRRYIAS